MNETIWNECELTPSMLEVASERLSLRSLRRFGVYCCRRVESLMPEHSRQSLGLIDRQTEEFPDPTTMQRIRAIAIEGLNRLTPPIPSERMSGHRYVAQAVFRAASMNRSLLSRTAWDVCSAWAKFYEPTDMRPFRIELADALREIGGNPWHPPGQCDRDHLTADVVQLARTFVTTQDRTVMKILADALEEAGNVSESILSHLRGDAAHLNDCWVLWHLRDTGLRI